MSGDISYQTQMAVLSSWAKVKLIDNYENKAGTLIVNRFFELEPQARLMFQFENDETVFGSPAAQMKVKQMVHCVEIAIDLLAPDTAPLQQEFRAIGRRHKRLGVQSRHLFAFEKAVTFALEELLEDDFKTKDRRAWESVFQFLIKIMQEGIDKNVPSARSSSSYF